MKIFILMMSIVISCQQSFAGFFGPNANRCETLFAPPAPPNFSTGFFKSLSLQISNRIFPKAAGWPLMHNSLTSYGFDLYFKNDVSWSTENPIGKKGTVVIWIMRESDSLYEGYNPRFDAYYVDSFKGKLISASNYYKTVLIEDEQGNQKQFSLQKRAPGPEVSLRAELRARARSNVDWDGDITGLSAEMGYVVTFIPN